MRLEEHDYFVAAKGPTCHYIPFSLINEVEELSHITGSGTYPHGGFTMNISDLSQKEFKELVNSMVDDRLCELLGDPDLGLALDDKVRAQLKQVLNSPERVTGETVAERLDLKW